MAKRPPEQKSPLERWDTYVAGKKARWIGTVEAADEDAAIKEAVKTLRQVGRLTDPAIAPAARSDRRLSKHKPPEGIPREKAPHGYLLGLLALGCPRGLYCKFWAQNPPMPEIDAMHWSRVSK